jgi:hypothetical protein
MTGKELSLYSILNLILIKKKFFLIRIFNDFFINKKFLYYYMMTVNNFISRVYSIFIIVININYVYLVKIKKKIWSSCHSHVFLFLEKHWYLVF